MSSPEAGAGWVPVMLALFGLGSFAGVTVAGRYADRRETRPVFVAGGTLLLGWIAFALTTSVPAATVVLVFARGWTRPAPALAAELGFASPPAPAGGRVPEGSG
jgi:predicted MFS family arabinose efflux permease